MAHAEPGQVTLHKRDKDMDNAARSKRSGDRVRKVTLAAEDDPHQGAPRQCDPQLIDSSLEHRQRRRCVSNQEQRVGQTTFVPRPSRAMGRFAQSTCFGVYANREDARIVAGSPENGRAITGAKIDDRPPVGGDQQVDLADVELGESPSNDNAHRGIVAYCRASESASQPAVRIVSVKVWSALGMTRSVTSAPRSWSA